MKTSTDFAGIRSLLLPPLVTKPGKPIPYLAGKKESAVTTYYFKNPEDALKRARQAGKQPGCWYGGIILPSGKKGWAIYKGGKIIAQYSIMKCTERGGVEAE